MATLTVAEKQLLRNVAECKANEFDIPIRWAKAAINDSGQAVEIILDSAAFKTSVSNAIDAASTPYGVTFTNTEKKWIGALVMELKHARDLLG